VEIGGTEKMSKSKNNGVDPQSMIEVRRRHLPPVHDVRLAARHEPGMVRLRRRRRHRFLRRVWRLAQAHVSQGLPGKLDVAALTTRKSHPPRHPPGHQAGQHDVGQFHKFNTAIAQVMTVMNVLEKAPQATEQDRALLQEGLEAVTLLLAPITRTSATSCGSNWATQAGDRCRLAERRRTRAGAGHLNWWFRSTASCAARSTCLPPPAAKKSKPPPAQRECAALHRRPDHPQGHRGTGQAGQHRRQLMAAPARMAAGAAHEGSNNMIKRNLLVMGLAVC
jgi:hypothetical protein